MDKSAIAGRKTLASTTKQAVLFVQKKDSTESSNRCLLGILSPLSVRTLGTSQNAAENAC